MNRHELELKNKKLKAQLRASHVISGALSSAVLFIVVMVAIRGAG